MNEAEGENYGKLENKVGSVKGETAPAQPQQIVAMQECGSCAVTFSWFFRKVRNLDFYVKSSMFQFQELFLFFV